MNDKKKLGFIRFTYRFGAVVDGLWAVLMLFPEQRAALLGSEPYDPSIVHHIDMGIAAALIAGWTCLLLWADRRPIERRGVLLLTIFPTVSGILISLIWGVFHGASTGQSWVIAKLLLLAPMFLISYVLADRKSVV